MYTSRTGAEMSWFFYALKSVDQWKDNYDLIAAWSNGEGYTNYHKHKIHYTESGRGYIRKGSLRIYSNINTITTDDLRNIVEYQNPMRFDN